MGSRCTLIPQLLLQHQNNLHCWIWSDYSQPDGLGWCKMLWLEFWICFGGLWLARCCHNTGIFTDAQPRLTLVLVKGKHSSALLQTPADSQFCVRLSVRYRVNSELFACSRWKSKSNRGAESEVQTSYQSQRGPSCSPHHTKPPAAAPGVILLLIRQEIRQNYQEYPINVRWSCR